MSSRLIKILIEKLKQVPINRLVLTGGEPLLEPDAVESLLKNIFASRVMINTNLTGVEKDVLRRILKYQTDLLISVPSMRKESYENTVGAATFDRFVDNLEEIAEYRRKSKPDIDIISNIVVTKYNLSHILETVNLLSFYGLDKIKISPVYDTGCFDKELVPKHEEFVEIYKACMERQYKNDRYTYIAPPLTHPVCELNQGKDQKYYRKTTELCPAGESLFTISPSGLARPCSSCLEYQEVDLYQELLDKLYSSFEGWKAISAKDSCKTCGQYKVECIGGCQFNAYRKQAERRRQHE